MLIVTASYDEAPSYMLPSIQKRGYKPFRLDTDRFPGEVSLTVHEDGTFHIADKGRVLHSDAIRSVWYRRHVTPEFPPGVEARFIEFGEREARAHLTGALLGLQRVRWMSHPSALWAAEKKPFQMRVAHSLGFAIPLTRVTNDPRVAEQIGASRSLVAKAVSSGYIHSDNGYDAIFTSRVSDSDLRELEGLSLAPVTFQEWVPKRSDIRVTVVGHEVFAAEILSQGRESSRIDWRATDTADLPHRRFDLAPGDAQRCLDLVSRLELSFGAIDLVLDERGTLQFLEINPNGEWMWIEDLVGYRISDAIAGFLTG